MRIPKLILSVVTSALLLTAASAEDKQPPAKNKVQELQKGRIATLRSLVDLNTELFKSASGQVSLEEILAARMQLIEAELETADTAAERVSLLEKQVAALKQSEELASRMVEIGRGTKAENFKAKARRLEAEIRLERAKAEPVASREQPGTSQPEQTVVARPQVKDVLIQTQFVAQLQAGRHIEVHSQLSGYLESVHVREGQAVKKGDLLFKLGPQLYLPKLDAAMAEVAVAALALKTAQRLFENKVISTEEVERAKAQLASAEAKAKLAQAELELTVIRAPFDGIIGRLPKQAGSLVTERDELTTLSGNSVMNAEFKIPEASFQDFIVNWGREENIELQLANGKKFSEPGKMASIRAQVDSATGTIACVAEFPNPEGQLRHGMSATVVFRRTLYKALVIPRQASFQKLDSRGKRYVYVVGSDNIVHQREIAIVSEVEEGFVINEGLVAGDKIVVRITRLLRDGEKLPAAELKHNE